MKLWHYDMMNDTMHVDPWFFATACFALGFIVGAVFVAA